MKRKCPLCELNYILNDNDEKCESCMNNKSKNNDCKTRNDKLSNYEIFTKYQQKFEINRKGFLIYLALRGYGISTKSKTKSTSFGYVNAVDKICEFENICFDVLLKNIEKYCNEYSLSGIKKDLGNYGNGTRRNALNRLLEFNEYVNKYQSK